MLGVVDLDVPRARLSMLRAAWPAEQLDAASRDAAYQPGLTCPGDDAIAHITHPAVEIVIECTGNPMVAVDHALAAFAAGKHVISGTVEAGVKHLSSGARKYRPEGPATTPASVSGTWVSDRTDKSVQHPP
ncbi:MAG: hypothetical protein AAF458_14575 [Pseudomonadota bacterium]